MKSITLNLPDDAAENEVELTRFIAAKLFERGKLSLGQAAELAKMTKREFAEILGNYGVSLVNHPAGDLSRDVANA